MGKAAGTDVIHGEMLKADLTTSTEVLTELFRNIWDKETIPDDWNEGLIVKLPKKGNLQNCDSRRGITLLCRYHQKILKDSKILQKDSTRQNRVC